ncbi:MAG: helix-turn-helix domain-containing protein [Candidatus Burarchaeum sp.]|nr:helix-turn-helix domain-containing protein [Candidatus Burarchaeum sp.]MDO8340083.1 helix-turn-helix domain-containing protein [Candidatus Burarchaeum sp.]
MGYPYAVKVAFHHDCWTNPTERVPDARLDVFGIGYDESSAFGMARMAGDEEQRKKLYGMIKRHPYTLETRRKNGHYFFIRVKKDTSFYAELVGKSYLADNNISIHEGLETERLFGFSKKALMNSLGRIREEREIKVLSMGEFADFSLAPKEQELLDLAMREGYYEIPRKIYAEELGGMLGLKKSIVSDRLRKIEKSLIEKYYSRN